MLLITIITLNFQTETFQQYIERLKREYRLRRFGMKIISPIAKLALLRMSPYYKTSNKITT
ncbi:MAG TPA: hypothetical protein ENH75_05255 [archaeon]|nr:hypothetical protein [archaeon]